jgi:hypothetical protein
VHPWPLIFYDRISRVSKWRLTSVPHDLRRSAAKALRAAGVAESVVMAIGGWKTAAIFRRYAIVSSADGRAAVEMLERARAERAAPALAAGAATFESADPTAAGGLKPN